MESEFEPPRRRPATVILIAVTVAVAPLAGTALADAADGWEQQAKITEPGTSYLGDALAVEATTAVASAPGAGTGSVFVYELVDGTWTRTAELTPTDGDTNDFFGEDVALDGDRLVVGAQFHDAHGAASAGAAYVFQRGADGWTQTAKLTADDADPRDKFGTSLALDGATAIVAAPQDDGAGEDAGAAYVFELGNAGWTQTAKLTVDDADPGDGLGSDVALDGDRAVVGAPGDDGGDADAAGAVHAFERGAEGFAETAKLVAPDRVTNGQLGTSVDVHGTTAIAGSIGHPGPDGVLPDGAAMVFEDEGGSWTHAATLADEDARPSSSTGTSVALDAGRALVGGEQAHVFVRTPDGWHAAASMAPLDDKPQDGFGWASALAGDNAFVSARNADTLEGRGTGAVYVFQPCEDDGPASGVVHEGVEPIVGELLASDGADEVHETNCQVIDQLEEGTQE